MVARVLVVDDILVNVKLLEAKLSKEYFDVLAAAGGREALEIAETQSPDIMRLDEMKPEMDGFEVCRRIKANPNTMHIPVVMVTALSDQADRVRGLEAGADDFLTKPVNEPELIARLNTGKRILELERSLLDANEKIKKLSRTDSLTKCYNRTYLSERLPKEIKRVKRYNLSLSLILFDIDFFKKVKRYVWSSGWR